MVHCYVAEATKAFWKASLRLEIVPSCLVCEAYLSIGGSSPPPSTPHLPLLSCPPPSPPSAPSLKPPFTPSPAPNAKKHFLGRLRTLYISGS